MNKFKTTLFILLLPFAAIAQETGGEQGLDFFVDILGRKGVLVAIGLLVFLYAYKNSIKLFDWIEDQTYGTRDYILQKCELLHVEIESRNVTYILLFLSFGVGVLVFGAYAFAGKFTTGLFMGAAFSIAGWK